MVEKSGIQQNLQDVLKCTPINESDQPNLKATPPGFVADFNLPVGSVSGPAQLQNAPRKPQTQRHQIIYCSRTIS